MPLIKKLELSIMAYSMFKTNSIMTSATVVCGKVALIAIISINAHGSHYILLRTLWRHMNKIVNCLVDNVYQQYYICFTSLELLSYNVLRIETRTIEPHTKLTITWFIILSLLIHSRLNFLNGKNNY